MATIAYGTSIVEKNPETRIKNPESRLKTLEYFAQAMALYIIGPNFAFIEQL